MLGCVVIVVGAATVSSVAVAVPVRVAASAIASAAVTAAVATAAVRHCASGAEVSVETGVKELEGNVS